MLTHQPFLTLSVALQEAGKRTPNRGRLFSAGWRLDRGTIRTSDNLARVRRAW